MSNYSDETNRDDLPLSQTPPYESEERILTRERRIWLAWTAALAGIVILLIVAGSIAIWPTKPVDSTSTASTKPDVINTQPSGPGTFNNNPASGAARPPEAVDRDPTPTGNGGGPTQVTTPSGTEKTR
jgi:hypothetical protein